MFDIGWAELLVIAVVLIVVVGPKDLPRMLRTFGRATTQMRRMAGDFRRQFDDALREAELDEVRDTIADVRKMNPAGDVKKALNPMKAVGDEIRASLSAATKASEPKVPAPDAPAQPSEPAKTVPAIPQPAMRPLATTGDRPAEAPGGPERPRSETEDAA